MKPLIPLLLESVFINGERVFSVVITTGSFSNELSVNIKLNGFLFNGSTIEELLIISSSCVPSNHIVAISLSSRSVDSVKPDGFGFIVRLNLSTF